MEKGNENKGDVRRVVTERSNVGGKIFLFIYDLCFLCEIINEFDFILSSSGSQEFWNSSIVENLLLAATTQTPKAIEMSKQIEEKES